MSYLSVVQLPVHINLPLCDVARQIRDGMSDVLEEQMETDGKKRENRRGTKQLL